MKRLCSLSLHVTLIFVSSLDADVVFLQEVIPDIVELVKGSLPQYTCLQGDTQGYFVVTLLRKQSVQYLSHAVRPFSSTKMERHLLSVEVLCNSYPVVLMNTHLESMAYSSQVRTVQLKKCFRDCVKASPEKTIIFGGDLNLRDSEVLSSGGLPQGIQDIWEVCGCDSDLCYTWDTEKNDNLQFKAPAGPKPKFRFDRVYVRHSQPPRLTTASFALIGQKRIQPEGCFPSDHWGLECLFECR